jgi:hypothetical protein
MTFAFTLDNRSIQGNRRVHTGTFTNSAGGTGGDIVTGLNRVESFSLQHKGSTATTNIHVVNETLPSTTGTMTIVSDADKSGFWRAVGRS